MQQQPWQDLSFQKLGGEIGPLMDRKGSEFDGKEGKRHWIRIRARMVRLWLEYPSPNLAGPWSIHLAPNRPTHFRVNT